MFEMYIYIYKKKNDLAYFFCNYNMSVYDLNISNDTCLSGFFWNSEERASRYSRLYTCIIASFVHTIFWCQLIVCPSVRQKSIQWIYAYLITDICLILRFFITYIFHTTSSACQASPLWQLIVCYFDAVVDNYFNILEIYILLALNICRYVQIKYNRNPYQIYPKALLLTHLGIYIIPLLYSFIQFYFNWCILDGYGTDRCLVTYSNIYIQVFNIIFTFFLPIFMNLCVIGASVQHVRSTSGLQRGQHHVSARDKYHRSLVIQFMIFYAIWLSLWSPNVILFQLSVGSTDLLTIFRLLNFIEIALDPIIIGALDIRFWHAWKKAFRASADKIRNTTTNQRRVQPSTANPDVFTIKNVPIGTTTL